MSRNYGIGTRDLGSAGRLWLQRPQSGLSYSSIATYSQRWEGSFVPFAKAQGVKRMEHITKELVSDYANHLIQQGQSAATIKNNIAAINAVMKQANSGWQAVKPSEIGVPKRSYVRTESPILDRDPLVRAKASLSDGRAKAIIDLTRELGLRRKEASLLDARKAIKEVRTKGQVTITEGTKGGRTRVIPITNQRQIDSLQKAANVQGKGEHSMIPADKSYRSFRPVLDRANEALVRETGGQTFHDLRSAFACERYKAITGSPAPVIAGHRVASKADDHMARVQIAKELGHGRTDVTAAYLGSSR
ncbi:integrase domain-containing protein [Candidatus Igneacidithiobacillus taiwanensis]|uniref:tyrosine-type recombinase/integrase n=1 Tax=Candidatus Igneacidithiobacillus taiwanensis TaxID=1945924 RepID=UPI00289C9503|nr:integrase domain-containing protein [Candidatus Igneacidithiobacillus taiwanensis]